MNIWYIKENERSNRLKEFFNIIKINNIDNKIICEIPISAKVKLNKRRIIRIAKKLNKKLYDNDINNIVLSKNLENIELLKNKLYSENINILDGRKLFFFLTYEILEYIFDKKNVKMEMRRSYCFNK